MDGWLDGLLDGWTDRQTDGLMGRYDGQDRNGWTQIDRQIDKQTDTDRWIDPQTG